MRPNARRSAAWRRKNSSISSSNWPLQPTQASRKLGVRSFIRPQKRIVTLATLPPLVPLTGTVRASSAPTDVTPAKTGAAATKQAEAFRQFESFILQSFIENMLPKNAESVFGKGTAGGVWKSMMAEKLADQISRSGGIGIARKLAGPQVSSAPPATQSDAAVDVVRSTDQLPLIRTYRSGDPS
ncbi:MAG: hypothetical protein HC868_09035 [Sphingomonadales bacterium]|nr:hypothetical protein [Sphingomonadales bacterium]